MSEDGNVWTYTGEALAPGESRVMVWDSRVSVGVSNHADPGVTDAPGSNDAFNTVTMRLIPLTEGLELQVAPGSTPGDFDLDGDVDAFDLGIWQTGFGTASGALTTDGDADGDGDVDAFDLGLWQTNFGTGVGANVPEPATAVMMLLAAVGVVRPRRR